MANIEIKGRMFYQVDATIAELFVAAGLAEHIVPKAAQPKPQEPEWQIVIKKVGNAVQEVACIQHFVNGQRTFYSGPPEHAACGFLVRSWVAPAPGEAEGHYGSVGPIPTPHILQAYREAYNDAPYRVPTAGDRPPGASTALSEGQKAEAALREHKNR